MLDPNQWPFFNLVVATPRLELRYATDELLLELTGVAGDVIPPGAMPFDGNATFYDRSSAGRRRWTHTTVWCRSQPDDDVSNPEGGYFGGVACP